MPQYDTSQNFMPIQGLLAALAKYLPGQGGAQPPLQQRPGQFLGNPTAPSSIGPQPQVNPFVASLSTTQPSPSAAKPNGSAGNMTPGLSTTPPISNTPVIPVQTFNADTPAQRRGDWSSATSLLPPVRSTDTPTADPYQMNLNPKAVSGPNSSPLMGLNPRMGYTTPQDEQDLQQKWKQSNMQSALSSLANLNSPSNYTKLLGGQ